MEVIVNPHPPRVVRAELAQETYHLQQKQMQRSQKLHLSGQLSRREESGLGLATVVGSGATLIEPFYFKLSKND